MDISGWLLLISCDMIKNQVPLASRGERRRDVHTGGSEKDGLEIGHRGLILSVRVEQEKSNDLHHVVELMFIEHDVKQ